MNIEELHRKISTPSSVLHESEQFTIKLADKEEEVEQALRLRYEIFNLEQGKGLKSAELTGIDRDEYDDYCLHLIVLDKAINKAIGTYRVHPGVVAKSSGIGFYSAREYDIDGIDRITDHTVEVGRSCVAPEYRSGAAVALLWGGIGQLLIRARKRYLLGCASLETVSPVTGWGLYQHFQSNGTLSDDISAKARDGFVLEKPDQGDINTFLSDKRRALKEIPPLLKGYLRLGTKVCGEPALDEEFGTIDYLILLDTATLSDRYARHFNYKCAEESN